MTSDALYESLTKVANLVVKDPRWSARKDDMAIAVLGMLLYGYALAKGRILFMLEIDEINATVLRCLQDTVGSAEKWTSGLVEDAARSAFNQKYNPGQFELIGAGQQYFPDTSLDAIVSNIYQNIDSIRGPA